VLDTWFSSALWPFSTLGWPQQTPDLARFYPTDVLETGYDILFFWVARMVMAAALFTNDIPFHTIYLHGLVRDEHGRKMSKTLNNVTDPLDVIREYGTDALRFTLLTGGTPGNDLNLTLERVASNRNFGNKIWNVARFVIRGFDRLSKDTRPDDGASAYTPADRWIVTRLSETVASANRLMDSFLFGEAGRQIYDFLWDDFADWYVEIAKVQMAGDDESAWTTMSVLCTVLDQTLRLLHPFIPFVTEETWQQLRRAALAADVGIEPAERWSEALIVADWPRPGLNDPTAAADFELIRELVRRIRNARAEQKVEPGRFIPALIAAGQKQAFVKSQRRVLAALARLDDTQLRIDRAVTPPDQVITLALGPITAYLPLTGMVDPGAEHERLTKEAAELDQQIQRLTTLLSGPFAGKAPPAVVQKERDKLAALQASRREIGAHLTQPQN
jgi:valyl-tRNA synthetase